MSDYIKMNRREWFKNAFVKTKETSLKATSKAVGNFADASETLKKYRWQTVANNRDIGDNPKQMMYQGKSIFILRVDEETLNAFQGICPDDQQLIFWRSHNKQFYCPSCGLVYDENGICTQDEEIKLVSYPVKVEDEHIQLPAD